MAVVSMTAQVAADLPVASESIPAIIPPTIPPTSKRVERSAASLEVTCPSSPEIRRKKKMFKSKK